MIQVLANDDQDHAFRPSTWPALLVTQDLPRQDPRSHLETTGHAPSKTLAVEFVRGAGMLTRLGHWPRRCRANAVLLQRLAGNLGCLGIPAPCSVAEYAGH